MCLGLGIWWGARHYTHFAFAVWRISAWTRHNWEISSHPPLEPTLEMHNRHSQWHKHYMAFDERFVCSSSQRNDKNIKEGTKKGTKNIKSDEEFQIYAFWKIIAENKRHQIRCAYLKVKFHLLKMTYNFNCRLGASFFHWRKKVSLVCANFEHCLNSKENKKMPFLRFLSRAPPTRRLAKRLIWVMVPSLPLAWTDEEEGPLSGT